ncbi:hypothetical protein F5Y15DRAFT_426046 [Xylariaceae sp. FL0016]|nr:hypothetical protein F5Y15DRAFT_426046 [Xylariaceae sp. FL0016]
MCDNRAGPLAPFCQPVNNTQLTAGSTIDVTWDPSFFGSPDALIQLSGQLTPLDGSGAAAAASSGQKGFVSDELRAGDGKYTWTIPDSYLDDGGNGGQGWQAALGFAVSNSASGVQTLIQGPTVQLARSSSAGASVNVAAIVVPVVAGTVLLVLAAAYLLMRRRDPDFSVRGLLPRGLRRSGGAGGAGGGAGYGAKKSIRERMAAAGGATVQRQPLGYDGGVVAPAPGENVFQRELRRQQTLRS